MRAELARFGVVAVLGLCADLGLAWALAVWGGWPLPGAAVAGFVCGAVVNYLLHTVWTFQAGPPSLRRGVLYLVSLGVVLGVRLGVLFVLERIAPLMPMREAALLAVAATVSFLVNYLLSRHIVFAAPGAPK